MYHPKQRAIRAHRRPADKAVSVQGSACVVCGWRIEKRRSYGLEVHHIKPVRDGGTNDPDNLVVLCPNHHAEADYGILTPEQLRAHRATAIQEAEAKKMAHQRKVVGLISYGDDW